jgi:hypothetical protein
MLTSHQKKKHFPSKLCQKKKLPPKALVAINIFFLGEVLHFVLPSVGLVLYLGVNFIIKQSSKIIMK